MVLKKLKPDVLRGEEFPDAPGVAVRTRVHPELVADGAQRDQEDVGAPPQRLAEGHPWAGGRFGGEGAAARQQRVVEVEGDAHGMPASNRGAWLLPRRRAARRCPRSDRAAWGRRMGAVASRSRPRNPPWTRRARFPRGVRRRNGYRVGSGEVADRGGRSAVTNSSTTKARVRARSRKRSSSATTCSAAPGLKTAAAQAR